MPRWAAGGRPSRATTRGWSRAAPIGSSASAGCGDRRLVLAARRPLRPGLRRGRPADGRQIASAGSRKVPSSSGKSADGPRKLRTLLGHRESMPGVAYRPDGARLASRRGRPARAGLGSRLRGRSGSRSPPHQGRIDGIAFSPEAARGSRDREPGPIGQALGPPRPASNWRRIAGHDAPGLRRGVPPRTPASAWPRPPEDATVAKLWDATSAPEVRAPPRPRPLGVGGVVLSRDAGRSWRRPRPTASLSAWEAGTGRARLYLVRALAVAAAMSSPIAGPAGREILASGSDRGRPGLGPRLGGGAGRARGAGEGDRQPGCQPGRPPDRHRRRRADRRPSTASAARAWSSRPEGSPSRGHPSRRAANSSGWTATSGRSRAVGYSSDGTRIASAGGDGGAASASWDRRHRPGDPYTPRPCAPVFDLKFAPDGSRIASAGARRDRADLGRRDRPRADRHPAHSGWVSGVSYTPDGSRLASARRGRSGQALGRRHRPERSWSSRRGGDHGPTASRSPPNGHSLAASTDGTVWSWDGLRAREP